MHSINDILWRWYRIWICIKFYKKCVIAFIISIVVLVITPSTETIYTMMTVNEITPDNIQTIGKTGKNVIDYIIDQIDKIVNEDKDKENKWLI